MFGEVVLNVYSYLVFVPDRNIQLLTATKMILLIYNLVIYYYLNIQTMDKLNEGISLGIFWTVKNKKDIIGINVFCSVTKPGFWSRNFLSKVASVAWKSFKIEWSDTCFKLENGQGPYVDYSSSSCKILTESEATKIRANTEKALLVRTQIKEIEDKLKTLKSVDSEKVQLIHDILFKDKTV